MKRIFRCSAERAWGYRSENPEEVWQRLPAKAHRMESHTSQSLVIHQLITDDWLVDE